MSEKKYLKSWQIKKLREVLILNQSGIWGDEPDKNKKSYPVIRSTEMTHDGHLDLTSVALRHINEDKVDRFSLNGGDILIVKSSGSSSLIGRCALFKQPSDKITYLFSNFVQRLRPNNLISPKFLYYFLNFEGRKFVEYLHTTTTGLRNLPIKQYLELQIPLPPIIEQLRIVKKIEELFEKIDKAKRLREEAIKETESLIPSALSQFIYQAEKGGWNYAELKDITYINRETRNPTKEIPNEEFKYIDITSVEQQTGRIKNIQSIIGKNAPSRARRIVYKDDIIMSMVRPYLKAFAIIPENYNNQICSTGFAVLTCKKEIIPKYLLHMLFSDYTIEQCNNMMLGAHYPALNNNQVSKIKIPLPSVSDQNRIVKYLDSVQSKVESLKELQQETQKEIENLKKSILDRAFKGELV